MATILFALYSLFSIGLWLYLPSSILTTLTGWPFGYSLCLSSAVVILYTTFGGMSAIVKTDTIQAAIVVFSLLTVVVRGTVELGGFTQVFWHSLRYEKLAFDFDLNPFTEKTTVMTLILGNMIYWTSVYTTSQSVFTRYLPASDLSKARRVLWIQLPLMMGTVFLWCYFGFVLYAYYHRCDPFLTERIKDIENLVPLYVNDLNPVPGFLGLFVCGIYSGSMSSISSSLNSVAQIANEHIIRKLTSRAFTSKWYIRGVAIGFGLLSIPVALASSAAIGNSLKARITVANTFSCPTFGVFLLGIFNPRANEKGALWGLVVGTMMGFFLAISHELVNVDTGGLDVSIKGCPKYYCDNVGIREGIPGCLNNNYTDIEPFQNPLPTSASFTSPDGHGWQSIFYFSHSLGGLATTFTTIIIGTIFSEFYTSTKKRKDISKYLATFLQDQQEDHTEHIEHL